MEEKELKTQDFAQASILKAYGLPLIRTDYIENRFLEFVFLDPDFIAEDLIEEYWNGELQVNAKKMMEAIRDLKTRIHHEKRMRGL